MVKQGYKQTEIGLIPNDWNIVSIEKLATDMSDGPFGSNLKKEHYTDDKQARIIQLSNIGENGWLDTNVKYTTFSHAKTISRCIVNPGHIIVAKMMPAGRAIICPSMEKMYVLGSDSIKLELNATLVNTKYFMYSTKSSFFQTQIKEETQGSTRARTSISKLRKNKVLLPSIEEQKRIAEALSDVDSMISSLEKLIAKKKAVKQGAMQELLTGKKRLSGFTGAWIEKRIENVAEVGRGRVISHIEISKNIGGKYPVYSSQTTNNGIMGYLRTYDFDGDYITWTTDGVNAGTVFHRSGKFNCTNVCGTLKCRDVNTDFVARRLGVETHNYVATNLANPKLMNDVMKRIVITLPPTIDEQTAITSILSDMDNQIEALEQKLAKTRQIKQGMMQQLLTGKIRLV